TDAAEIVVRELAVFRKVRDPVIHGPLAHIREALLLELLNCRHHVVDVLGGFDDAFGPLQAQHRSVLQKGFGVDRGELLDRLVGRGGVADDFVVHICCAPRVRERIPARAASGAECPGTRTSESSRYGRSCKPWGRTCTCGRRYRAAERTPPGAASGCYRTGGAFFRGMSHRSSRANLK